MINNFIISFAAVVAALKVTNISAWGWPETVIVVFGAWALALGFELLHKQRE